MQNLFLPSYSKLCGIKERCVKILLSSKIFGESKHDFSKELETKIMLVALYLELYDKDRIS